VMMACGNGTVLFKPINSQVDSVFWNVGNAGNGVKLFQRWIYGVLGSAMASWGMLLAFIAHYPFRKHDRWAWNCMALGILVWYFIDTPISIYFGVYFNALFNTILLALVILPLVFTRRDFAQAGNSGMQ
jgi:hypothetical protein